MSSLKITHLPTDVEFEFNTQGIKIFNESYSSSWNSEQAFGRMDPILSFSSTQRKISFEIALTEALDKAKAASIARLMYPTYNNSNALSIKEPPLVRIEFDTLISGQNNKGLICAIESLTVDRGESYSSQNTDFNLQENQASQIVLQFDVIPLHEYDMGWFKIVEEGELKRVIKAANGLLNTKRVEGGNKGNPKINTGAVVYHFGSDEQREIAFSSRKLNQIFTGGIGYSTKKKKK